MTPQAGSGYSSPGKIIRANRAKNGWQKCFHWPNIRRHPCACHRGPFLSLVGKMTGRMWRELIGMDPCDKHRDDGARVVTFFYLSNASSPSFRYSPPHDPSVTYSEASIPKLTETRSQQDQPVILQKSQTVIIFAQYRHHFGP